MRAAAADAGRHTPRPRRGGGGHPAPAGVHGQVRAALEHPGDDRAARAAGGPWRRLRAAHGRRQDPRRRDRLPAADARGAGGRRRDLARRALPGGGDAAHRVLRHRAELAPPRPGREPGAVDEGPGVRRAGPAGHPQPDPDARGAARRGLPVVRGQPGRRGGGRDRRGGRPRPVPAGGRPDRPGRRAVHPASRRGAAARLPRGRGSGPPGQAGEPG